MRKMAKKVKNGLGDQKKNPTDDAQWPLGVTFWHRRQGLWVGFVERSGRTAVGLALARSAEICAPKWSFSKENPLKTAFSQHPANRLPLGWSEIHSKSKKSRPGGEKSWPGGSWELARRRSRAGQEAAQSWPKAGQNRSKSWPETGQKVAKKWSKSDPFGGVAKMEVKNHAFSRMRHGLKPSFSDEIKGGYMIFVIFGGSRKSIQKLVQNWPKTGQKLARNWPRPGQKPARNWPETGQKLAASGSRRAQKLVRNRPQIERKVVKSRSKKWAKS